MAEKTTAQLEAENRRLRGWLEAIGNLAEIDAGDKGWMVRNALRGDEPPVTEAFEAAPVSHITIPNDGLEPTPFWRPSGPKEWMCAHDVGHPGVPTTGTVVHGCDGCCRREDFPGRAKRSG